MDSLRLILLILGVVLIAGIYLWDTRWRRSRVSKEFDDLDTRYLDELGDSRSRKDYGYAWEPDSRRQAHAGDEFPEDTNAEIEDVEGEEDLAHGQSDAEVFEDTPAQEAVKVNEGAACDTSEEEVTARNLDLALSAEDEAELSGLERIVPGSQTDVNGKLASAFASGHQGLLIALTVMAPAKASFSGVAISELMEELGCTFGEMRIFHKLPEHDVSESIPLYSVANALKPGTFDLGSLEEFSTPGIALFMQVSGQSGSVQAFDSMVEAGTIMAQRLGGELRDESRSTLTHQAINHLREQIVEFGRQLRVKSIE